jgi:DNA recombination protein RmuC
MIFESGFALTVLLVLACAACAFLAWWLATRANQQQLELQLQAFGLEKTQLTAQNQQLQQELTQALLAHKSIEVQLNSEQQHHTEKLALLQNAREELSQQFKQLAQQVLQDKGQQLSQTHRSELDLVLSPLKQHLEQFGHRINEVYRTDTEDRAKIKAQVDQLISLNQHITHEAHQLTQALKGSNKTQGNWGELVLERLLEMAGLRDGIEFSRQTSFQGEEGSRLVPDIVIHLPQQKCLVVDSKVSLTAYQSYTNSDNDADRSQAIKRHIDSIRQHIRLLSTKQYETYVNHSIDFVVLFVPIEAAFMLAVGEDSQLHQEAWQKNVLLVSPSNLLFVLRTVSYLWGQERQQQNAQDIAKRGAALYDKLSAFVGDLDKLSERLSQAQSSLSDAKTKLTGHGGAIRQAEMLKDLGVKPTKQIAASWITTTQNALDDQTNPTETRL